ncbi:hypothetical protein N5D61_02680 [Pseudomonas sp. GD03842]|uniref:hypothetical protein n=1 Tax=Pseudomonas sp. GD03842 TaxID=2975385 RepID=UPI0024494316|nr:hypothetical protein [Pseudomonas sp. GD03842]MDH0745248.1 hypothetical protein [Pseudomonas sp. GD03842]
MIDPTSRIVCQFSCGAASAVATKLAIAQYGATHEVVIVNAYLANEHPDNRRFAVECEVWFGQPITVLRDEKYGADIIQVFKRERYIKNRYGACCTKLLKRRVLDQWKRPGDVMVFGFTAEERNRFDDFCERNPERPAIAPLIERGLGKDDCKAIIERAQIELPMMYRMGYHNANCIACAKGGEGYFRAIREDFPEQFEELCQVQDELGPGSYLHRDRETNVRFSLRELGDGPVRRNEKIPACSFFCELAEADIIASA